jgi:hypothetical protein
MVYKAKQCIRGQLSVKEGKESLWGKTVYEARQNMRQDSVGGKTVNERTTV